MLVNNRPQIGVLRISSPVENSISSRLSISAALNSVEFTPRGIPPSSILIVREIKDPMPGHFSPSQAAVESEWSQKLRDSITDIYRKASRPVSGIIPYNASAVFFTDEAELLACLLIDASRGMAGERWWWKLILKNIPGIKTGGLKGIMQMSAANLPASLSWIHEWGQMSFVFSALSPHDSEEVFSTVCREYGIPEPQIRRFIVEMRKIDTEKKQRNIPEKELKQEGSRKKDFSEVRDYLRSVIGGDTLFSIHGKEKLSLFALCLVLRYRPSLARTQVLVTGLLEFLSEFPEINTGYTLHKEKIGKTDSVEHTEDIKKKDDSLFFDDSGQEIKTATHDVENRERKIITAFDFKSVEKTSVGILPSDGKQELPYVKNISAIRHIPISGYRKEHYGTGTDVQTEISREHKNKSGTPPINADETASEPRPEIEYQDKESPDGYGPIFPDNGIKTRLCGVFYLINLMRELDLPECFEDVFGLSSQVGAWGTLELLARAMIGNEERFETDPLWEILAGLDGREAGYLPESHMNDLNYYGMPPLWFEKCKQKMRTGFYWGASNNKLRIWSNNFVIVENETGEASPLENLLSKTCEYGIEINDIVEKPYNEAPLEEIEIPGLSQQLCRLMSCIMPFIRWHLRMALDPGEEKEEPEKDMLISSGRLYLTSTHIDIIMKLDDISIPVRTSGLDVDPGWAADFGRVVKFHFE